MKPILAVAAFAWGLLLAGASGHATVIHAIDLAQDGSATLIVQEAEGKPKAILVDTGRHSLDPQKGAAKVREYLTSHGIKQLDLVILTHIDADHAGGFKTLMSEVPQIRGPPLDVKAVLEPAVPPTKPKVFYSDLIKETWLRDIPRWTPDSPEAKRLLTELDVMIFAEAWKKPILDNDLSLVVAIKDSKTGRHHVISGDLTKRTFDKLKDRLPRDVASLQAPHHGGDRVLLDMLQRMSVDRIVIQANIGNQHGHPRVEVLAHLARQNTGSELADVEASRRELLLRHEHLIVGDLPAANAAATAGQPKPQPFFFEAISITGHVGTVVIDGDVVQLERPGTAAERYLREIAWLEMRHLSQTELAGVRSFREAQAYSVLKSERFLSAARTYLAEMTAADYAQRPAWLNELVDLAERIAGIDSSNFPAVREWLIAMSRPAALETFARSLIPSDRVRPLAEQAASNIASERREAVWDQAKIRWRAANPTAEADDFAKRRQRYEARAATNLPNRLEDIQDFAHEVSRSMETLTTASTTVTEAEIREWLANRKEATMSWRTESNNEILLHYRDGRFSVKSGPVLSDAREWLNQNADHPLAAEARTALEEPTPTESGLIEWLGKGNGRSALGEDPLLGFGRRFGGSPSAESGFRPDPYGYRPPDYTKRSPTYRPRARGR